MKDIKKQLKDEAKTIIKIEAQKGGLSGKKERFYIDLLEIYKNREALERFNIAKWLDEKGYFKYPHYAVSKFYLDILRALQKAGYEIKDACSFFCPKCRKLDLNFLEVLRLTALNSYSEALEREIEKILKTEAEKEYKRLKKLEKQN